MLDQKNRYIVKNYQEKPTFSSFLPGVAGQFGVPLWCYYNNRGQAVCSFGASDRDHAIMEFSAAHTAYRDVSRKGFRTFVRADSGCRELFTENCDMYIGASEVRIRCESDGFSASAVYFGLPGERCAALARIFTLKNISGKKMSVELLDGFPEVVCYGVNQDSLKNMPQLSKAWMRAEDYADGRACFRVRASMGDSAKITEVKGANFAFAKDDSGHLLRPLVQPDLIFGEDTSLSKPAAFYAMPLADIINKKQVAENCFPCCFFPVIKELEPDGEIVLYELYGQVSDKSRAADYAEKISPKWFEDKRQEAADTVDSLTLAALTETADPVFDGYSRITYLDNVLRGGAPIFFEHGGSRKPFYIYSRKHGDPEREYNYFSLGGEYFAQGNGNFRDVNQNRRSDVLFSPDIKDVNIHTFFDLIQTDGYNPLVLTAATFRLSPEKAETLSIKLPAYYRDRAAEMLSHPFTPGALAMTLEDWGLDRSEVMSFVSAAVCSAESEPDAVFQEGYWSDHFTYNLDLIESYLSVWPDDGERLIFDDRSYRWYSSRAAVRPRAERYTRVENGIRQYNATYEHPVSSKWATTGSGEEMRSTLIEKVLLLIAIKTATLDPAGMGIEMEAGKPGWYDALNGLPGLLGSSTAETCELLRLVRFAGSALAKYDKNIGLYEEIYDLLSCVSGILKEYHDPFERWNRLNNVKESYRSSTMNGYGGKRVTVSGNDLKKLLDEPEKALADGISRAVSLGGGIIPTYFTYDDENYEMGGTLPKSLKQTVLPLFLEGPVHWLKLDAPTDKKLETVRKVRNSGLYDEKLRMYKVNDSLKDVSYEAGRCRAFSPGWLENESIWLHMEYKYLLELLRSGLYDEFSEAFHDAAVPFLDPDVYGRSPLENVSFIASSANPDEKVRGRGFVARLSGSTAEFLQIREIMFFGEKPFTADDSGLKLELRPFIPEYLVPESKKVSAMFLGGTMVEYDLSRAKKPGTGVPEHWKIIYKDGRATEQDGEFLGDHLSRDVRSGLIEKLAVTVK